MENYENVSELEQLRQQVREFKQRLDRQEIISQRLLRQSMRSKASWVKTVNLGLSAVGICLLPVLACILRYGMHLSWAPILFICVMIVCEAAYNLWSTRPLRAGSMSSRDLVTVKREMMAFERRERMAMCIEVPLIVLWFVWMEFDLHALAVRAVDTTQQSLAVGMFYGAIIGGAIGLAFAFALYFKSQRKIRQIVAEIEEFQA